MTTVITPPDMNDSFSRVVLAGKEYLIRFTCNDTRDYWTFGIYDGEQRPLVAGIKMVPNSPLNFFYQSNGLPDGTFGVLSDLDRIGRRAFIEGKAKFVFIPNADLE